MGAFGFTKEERLCKKKDIQELFTKGSSFYFHPFKIIVLPTSERSAFHQVLVTVSSRNFKRAVDRNLIKRRVREAYRLQKHKLSPSPRLLVGFIYTAKEILSFSEISSKMLLAFGKIDKTVKFSGKKSRLPEGPAGSL